MPPSADVQRDLAELLGHLEALRGTELSRLQQARLDLAVAAADALARGLGGGPDDRPRIPTATGSRAPRALVVDDNSITLHVALSMLRVLGAEAAAAQSGGEALDALGAYPYDLVLLDVMLPDVDGVEVARRIRSQHGDRPCIVGVTGMPGVEGAARAAGMDAVYAKPLRMEQVSAALALCVPGQRD